MKVEDVGESVLASYGDKCSLWVRDAYPSLSKETSSGLGSTGERMKLREEVEPFSS